MTARQALAFLAAAALLLALPPDWLVAHALLPRTTLVRGLPARAAPASSVAQALLPVRVARHFLAAAPQTLPASREAQFRQLADQLARARQAGAAESQAQEEQALALLDGFVLDALNAPGGTPLDALNRQLQSLVTRQPAVGEGYRVMAIATSPPAFALLADFGLAGPSAVRVYVGTPGEVHLAAGIDRYSVPDFLDDYLELVPVEPSSAVFVTVAGRTDALATGIFIAWRFDSGRVEKLWSSDILQQSSYEARPDGLRLTYCAQTDDERPEICRRMVEDFYRFIGGRWTRVSEKPLAPPKK
jgi:hypothetical protein